jgi:uncharacterized protein YaeQ
MPAVSYSLKDALRGRLIVCGPLSASHGSPDGVGNPSLEGWQQIMAHNAAIYNDDLSISDIDPHYYETHKPTVAKHPSETDERLMVRIFAFALSAHERLEMAKGLSTDDKPDIWLKSLSGEIDVWVVLGLLSEKVIRQSCSTAEKVIVYPYGAGLTNRPRGF